MSRGKGVDLYTLRFELRRDYREAMDKALAAKSPEDRQHWASKAAVAISELQHPSLVALP